MTTSQPPGRPPQQASHQPAPTPAKPPAPTPAPTPDKPPEDLPPKTENYPPPEDFHLAKPGSRDYVAGQPADEEELAKTEAERGARLKAAQEEARKADHKAADTKKQP